MVCCIFPIFLANFGQEAIQFDPYNIVFAMILYLVFSRRRETETKTDKERQKDREMLNVTLQFDALS